MSLTPEKIQQTLDQAGLLPFFPVESIPALTRFTLKMLQINETLNLTRWVEDEQVLNFHVLDSAFALPLLQPLVQPAQRWVDLGTGCGFPGAVLLGAFPQVEVSLLDSVAKKTKALWECVQEAGWKAPLLIGRAEEVGRDPQHRESYDGVVARAVADFRVVLEYGMPLLKTGGYLVNWMTEDQMALVDKSREALQVLQAKVAQKKDYSLPGSTQRRWLVLVEKVGKTPEGYPRPIGVASKKPL